MTGPTVHQQLEQLDAALAQDPSLLDVRHLRATLLVELGDDEAAKAEFLRIIAIDPSHFGALNDLGALLYRTDFRTAARSAYGEAVKRHPLNPIGRINLGNALAADGLLQEAETEFRQALVLAPEHPDAHQGLANLLQEQGRFEEAEDHRQQSYRRRRVTQSLYRGGGRPTYVLLLNSGVGGNVPTRFLLDDEVFATSVLLVESYPMDVPLPAHDLIFNGVGDADLCDGALQRAEALLKGAAAPIINPPQSVRLTGRSDIAQRASHIPGIRAPRVVEVERHAIDGVAGAFGFPLLVRSKGYHTGRNFARVETKEALGAVVEELPGSELLLIEYLDATDPAGWSRKYRVMMIEFELYPLHLAVSRDWKVHYFSADMAERPDHRAEEALFLDNMQAAIGPTAVAALRCLARELGLDYAGADFAVSAAGEVMLFEANATMVVNPIPKDAVWDYRRPAVDRIMDAAHRMLKQRAEGRG